MPEPIGHWPFWGINVVANLVIAVVLLTIPIQLFYLTRQRPAFKSVPLLVSCSVLAVSLGLLSLVDIGLLWGRHDGVKTLAQVLAAIAAVITAGLLWRAVPRILAMPSERQLREATDALARATRELDAFTSSVSHDLRSPLTTIAGQAGLLELSMGASANEDQRRRLQRIQHSVKQLSELIDALLLLSRISRLTLHREIIDVSALATTAVADLRRNDPARVVEVSIQPGISVHGDRRLVSDLVANLLSNAWKFTSRTPDSHIDMGVTTAGYMTTLHVRDNGAGFDMAYAQKLFKPFQRLHGVADFPGAGIGLATAARIIERHGGRIWAEAQPNKGACFYFTLPTLPITDEIHVGRRN